MSEYWKSTPKYWCKHCSTFVRDTKLEKANHEATPKHQGNLKRFLRDLHRGHEKDEKDKERAKSEVARLNGIVTGAGSVTAGSSSSTSVAGPSKSFLPKPQATPSQRKQQLAQLAEMGVAIPDEFRPDMAMAGEWQVTSERIVSEGDGEQKPDAIALGVRKRQLDEEEEEALKLSKRRWGSTYKTHPGVDDDSDLDALLSNATPKMPSIIKKENKDGIKTEQDSVSIKTTLVEEEKDEETPPGIKSEPSDPLVAFPDSLVQVAKAAADDETPSGVVFKKRKAKNIRQK